MYKERTLIRLYDGRWVWSDEELQGYVTSDRSDTSSANEVTTGRTSDEVSNGRYCQLRWLDQYFDIPRTRSSMDESQFNKEMAAAMKKQTEPKKRTTPTT